MFCRCAIIEDMKICKDGRISGQNNKEAGTHLGILTGRKQNPRKWNASEIKRGNKNPFYGKHHTEEARRKSSEAKMGAKHPRWKGGVCSEQTMIRKQIEIKLWREAVFARDNWTCQECGKWGGRLQAHHIKSFAQYPELRFAMDNGKTLCQKCHKLTENFGGRNKSNGVCTA